MKCEQTRTDRKYIVDRGLKIDTNTFGGNSKSDFKKKHENNKIIEDHFHNGS